MTREEFAKFSMALKTYYPKDNIMANEQAMELWYTMLQDIDYRVAEMSLNKWVATNKWSPTIADLREMAFGVNHELEPSWSESFQEARDMIRRYGYPREKEALEHMTPITRQVVKQMGYQDMCMCEDIEVERGQYRMIFETTSKRNKEHNQLPERLREQIADTQRRMLNG